MKKVFVTLIVALMIVAMFLLASCGGSTNSGSANQDAFLSDMAKGIEKRLSLDEDTSSMSAEEKYSLYTKLVSAELGYIEKYQNATFSDDTFNELAHMYINACKAQLFAAKNFKNTTIRDGLWDGGYSARRAIITELYERYDLPLKSESAALYSSVSGSVQTVVVESSDGTYDVETGLMMYDDQMVKYENVVSISENTPIVIMDDQGVKVEIKNLSLEGYQEFSQYQIDVEVANSLENLKAACYISDTIVDDYQINCYHSYGYDLIEEGKKGLSSFTISNIELDKIGKMEFDKLSGFLYVFTSDGSIGRYIAKIPFEITRDAFTAKSSTAGSSASAQAVYEQIISDANGAGDYALQELKNNANTLSDTQVEDCLKEIGRWGAVDQVKAKLAPYMKNPYTFTIYEGTVSAPSFSTVDSNGNSIYKVEVHLEYGAENSFGGMVHDSADADVYYKYDRKAISITYTETKLSPITATKLLNGVLG